MSRTPEFPTDRARRAADAGRCESGRLRCVNAFGTGVADDKLAHAYVETMVRFYLGEEPLLRSVPSFDLADPDGPRAALDRLDELVIKPRDGFGGHGVTIMPRATERERRRGDRAGAARARSGFVAQETVRALHPPDGLRRPACGRATSTCDRSSSARATAPTAMPGGLTRFARGAGEMVVNSSRGGGCKDTWVLGGQDRGGDEARSLASRRERPLIGVTTSEVRRAESIEPTPEGEPPRHEMALGLTYLRAIEAAGAPAGGDAAAGQEAIEPLLDRLDGICLSGGPDLDPETYGAEPHPSSARPSPTSTASSSAIAAPGRRARDPDPGDLPRHPGAERRPRRHAAPAPARPLERDRPPPEAPGRPAEPPGEIEPGSRLRRRPRRRDEVERQLLPPPGDRPARRGTASPSRGRRTARSRRSRTRAGAS